MFSVWPVLGVFGLVLITSLLTKLYMRRRDGIQPGYKGFLIMATAAGCGLLAVYCLERLAWTYNTDNPASFSI